MRNMLNLLVVLLVTACFSTSGALFAADSTSFNPVPITVTAKGAGGVPVGTIIAWPVASNPDGVENWLECNGQAISQSAYPELYALMGGNVPNYQGLFLRGKGSQVFNSGGYGNITHASGDLGQIQGDGIRNITGHFGDTILYRPQGDGAFYISNNGSKGRGGETGTYHIFFDASRIVPTANENRPINKSVRYLIRAKP